MFGACEGVPEISIHTPARGVTPQYVGYPISSQISIHTPARGVTQLNIVMLLFYKFQSTLPHGE